MQSCCMFNNCLYICEHIKPKRYEMKFLKLLSLLSLLSLTVGLAISLAIPTMLLWNWLMPSIFCVPEITIWQALGLNMLSFILIKTPTK